MLSDRSSKVWSIAWSYKLWREETLIAFFYALPLMVQIPCPADVSEYSLKGIVLPQKSLWPFVKKIRFSVYLVPERRVIWKRMYARAVHVAKWMSIASFP